MKKLIGKFCNVVLSPPPHPTKEDNSQEPEDLSNITIVVYGPDYGSGTGMSHNDVDRIKYNEPFVLLGFRRTKNLDGQTMALRIKILTTSGFVGTATIYDSEVVEPVSSSSSEMTQL